MKKITGYAAINSEGEVCINVDEESVEYISSAVFFGKNLKEAEERAKAWVEKSFPTPNAVENLGIKIKKITLTLNK